MKILHLISERPPIRSGFSRVICRLTEELTKIGHEVKVLSTSDCKTKIIGELKITLSIDSIVRELIKDYYDIVDIHGHTPTFSDRLLHKSKHLGKKTIYTLHCLADYPLKPITAAYNFLINRILLKYADAVIVTTKSYYDMLPNNIRKYIVPWGIDHEKFTGPRIPHDDYRVLFVGQMRPYKGLKILLKAVKEIKEDNLTLNIVGEGPDRHKYEKYARKLGLKRAYFHGSVPDETLRKMYLSSDILVLPSVSKNEAFGLVTLEAAAAGCAVIASDLPGVRDVVKEFGILIKPGDVESLRKALLELMDEGTRRKYVERGFKAITKYSWQRTAREYEKIYLEIIDR
ncbi:MAG: glycosyltransferase family 4 protein [Candidatus Bathyarchaeia archaeon]